MFSQPQTLVDITGCSSGLGYALTRAALTTGHTVIAVSRSLSKAPGSSGGGDEVVKVQWAALESSFSHLEGDFKDDTLPLVGGKIDVLINNAGTGIVAVVEDVELSTTPGPPPPGICMPLRRVHNLEPEV